MTDQPDKPDHGAPRSSQDDEARRMPKRFYSQAKTANLDTGFAIQLDGRTIKTPSSEALVVPTEPLARAIAAEWNALGDEIDPAKLPLTKIANTAIDGVRAREREVHDDIARYIGNDLLFYRAETPEALIARQVKAWDPILQWFSETFGAEFRTTTGIMPIEQNMISIAKTASALTNETAMSLASLHLMTTLTGSALLTIAHLKAHLTIDEVWHATHIDEDWQIEQWGHDDEAAERRARRRNELQNFADFFAMLRQ
jgi:chaperone required for assembly of F1-ATPase